MDEAHVLELEPEALLTLLKVMKGESRKKFEAAALESIDAVMDSINQIRYEVKLEIRVSHTVKPKSAMEAMVRQKHHEMMRGRALPALTSAVQEMLKRKDMEALEKYYDLAEKLRTGAPL